MIGDVLEISAMTLVHYGAYASGLSAHVVFSSRVVFSHALISLLSFRPGQFISVYYYASFRSIINLVGSHLQL